MKNESEVTFKKTLPKLSSDDANAMKGLIKRYKDDFSVRTLFCISYLI